MRTLAESRDVLGKLLKAWDKFLEVEQAAREAGQLDEFAAYVCERFDSPDLVALNDQTDAAVREAEMLLKGTPLGDAPQRGALPDGLACLVIAAITRCMETSCPHARLGRPLWAVPAVEVLACQRCIHEMTGLINGRMLTSHFERQGVCDLCLEEDEEFCEFALMWMGVTLSGWLCRRCGDLLDESVDG